VFIKLWRAVAYQGLQESDKDLETLHNERGSTKDGIHNSTGPDIKAIIPTTIESEVTAKAGQSK
jgi:hypothetical protein